MTTPPPSSSGAGAHGRPCAHCQTLLPASVRWCGTCGARVLRDFFISYHHADAGWATWIAWQLEAAGYTTLLQAWDLRPGRHFLREMDEAMQGTRHTVAVLSPDYLTSLSTAPESGEELRRDPTWSGRRLLPVQVRDCQPTGWLASVGSCDLLGQPEEEALGRLLSAIPPEGRPRVAPGYPGTAAPAYPAVVVSFWHVPYRRNPYFSGRDALLEQVRATFTRVGERIVTQAVSGLGGVGKTQTALEYAYRCYRQPYQSVFWAQAETREQLLLNAAELAARLQLPERDEPDQAKLVAAVRRWLEEHPGWLLVLDDVEELPVVRDLLPMRGQGHVLLTTRAQALSGIEGWAKVEPLPTEDAMLLLLRRAHLLGAEEPLSSLTPQQQQQARTLVEELGGLPLTLDQAGAYLDETGCGLADYLTLYQTQRKMALSRRGERVAEDREAPPEAVGVTWAVSFQQVERRSPAAVELLRLCAYLAPEGIPEALLKQGGDNLPPALQEAIRDDGAWNTALSALRQFSLLDQQAETKTLSLHRLVQVVVQEALPKEEQRAWVERVLGLLNRAYYPDPAWFLPTLRDQVLPHALSGARHQEAWQVQTHEAAGLLGTFGWRLRRQARSAEALPLLQRALAIWEQALVIRREVGDRAGEETTLNNLGSLAEDLGRKEEAAHYFEQALAIREEAHGPPHPTMADDLVHLAELYQELGQYAEALPLLKRALAIWERNLPDHPIVATCLEKLASLYWELGQYAEALPLLKRALAIDEQAYGPTHPEVATDLEGLAALLRAIQQPAQAAELEARAQAIRATRR